MSSKSSTLFSHYSDTAQNDSDICRQAQMMANYACTLKDKVLLEKELTTLKFINTDLESRLKVTRAELEETKQKIQTNDELIQTFKKQLEQNKQNLSNEQEVYKNYSKQREVLIDGLRDDVKLLRKRLTGSIAELDKAKRQVDHYKQRCFDYQDKLRGFAILFTYFNDPKREKVSTCSLAKTTSMCNTLSPVSVNVNQPPRNSSSLTIIQKKDAQEGYELNENEGSSDYKLLKYFWK